MTQPSRILVVDDEADVELLLTQKFRREIRSGDMAFRFARDGKEALDILAEDPDFSMVLSDINMPGMDGLTLLNHLAEQFDGLKAVVVSAYSDLTNIRTAMNRGAFDFVTKPIDMTDLETTIRKTLRHSSEAQQLRQAKTEAELARATLARYFSPAVVEMVSCGTAGLLQGGERREATFLFTDLADFTQLVETSPSDLIVELLNGYFDGLARIVFAHDGTVMKVNGDALQAIFGAPVEQADHATRAVACALEIDRFTEEFRAAWRKRDVSLGVTRIGINTGLAIIGNFGGETFFDYTAYGSAVNTAARLETANKTLGTRICVSQSVVDAINGFEGRPAGDLEVAGRSTTIRAYEPLTSAIAGSAEMAAYRIAFEKLEQSTPDARQSFAALMGQLPDDPLTLLHLQRALGGATDVNIDATRK